MCAHAAFPASTCATPPARATSRHLAAPRLFGSLCHECLPDFRVRRRAAAGALEQLGVPRRRYRLEALRLQF